MDSITNILIADATYCAAAKKYAEHDAAALAVQHRAQVARLLGDLEGWLAFAREERALMPTLAEALMAQHDAAMRAVERWLGPAPTVAHGEAL